MLAQDAQQRPTAHHSAGENTQWQRWLSSSVCKLESANLLRTLHPVSTTLSPVEVCSGRTSARASTGLISLLMSMLSSQVEISHSTLKEWHDSIADISGSEHLVDSQVQLWPSVSISTENHADEELPVSEIIGCNAGQHEIETIQLERLHGSVPASSYLQSSC